MSFIRRAKSRAVRLPAKNEAKTSITAFESCLSKPDEFLLLINAALFSRMCIPRLYCNVRFLGERGLVKFS
jgi:hypothetical protein